MARQFLGEVAPLPGGVYGLRAYPGLDGRDAFGGFRAYDVGKRVYRTDGVLQMENDQQRADRLGATAASPTPDRVRALRSIQKEG